MRVFWAAIGILLFVAAGFLLWNRGGTAEEAPRVDRAERAARQAQGVNAPDNGGAPAQAAGDAAAPAEEPSETAAQRHGHDHDDPRAEAAAPPAGAVPERVPHTPESPLEAPDSARAAPAAGHDPAADAQEAQAILREFQAMNPDPSWTRVQRLWMADIHAEVDRNWDDTRDAAELAHQAVGSDSMWREAYLEMAEEGIAETLRGRGLQGETLIDRQAALLRGVEKAIADNVEASIITRRETAAAAPAQPATGPAPEQHEVMPAMSPEEAPAGTTETAANDAGEPVGGREWLVRRDDGSMLADGRYIVRGKGTAEEPYKISWEHLISAEEEYVPRDGRTEIPKRIQMLHDKHVEITGYIAFPLLLDSADELLVMLNQWDGCCLGVPPTPYDAVEVLLKDVVKGNARMASYGTVAGKLKVEPHLVGGWLVGLYLMENATLKPLAFGGFAP